MSSTNRACEILRSRLSSGEWQPGDRLPKMADLAEMCSVSLSTMQRVLVILRGESLLHANPGGAIVAGPWGTPRLGIAATGLMWQRLKAKLGKDILSGLFDSSRLPLVSKLALQYGVTIRTMRKALDQLAAEGLIAVEGRGYRLAADLEQSRHRSMVLIAAGDKDGLIFSTDPRTQSLVESFERECARRDVVSVTQGFDDRSPDGLISIQTAIANIGETEGYLVTIWPSVGGGEWSRWLDLFRFLIARHLPVIIISQAGKPLLPEELSKSRFLRVLAVAAVRAGEMVGRMIHRRGHKRVAYITPFFKYDWAQDRYAGLCRYYRQYGSAECEVELHAQQEIGDHNLELAMLGLDEPGIRSLYRDRLSPHQMTELVGQYHQVKQTTLWRSVPSNATTATIRFHAKALAQLADVNHDRPAYNKILDMLLHLAGDSSIELYLQPFFGNILRTSKATAWICSDQTTALTALSFLKKQGVKVPKEIAVVGFENWADSVAQGLSAYDFNMNGMIRQALLFIADKRNMRDALPTTEVDGYMVERRTTLRFGRLAKE